MDVLLEAAAKALEAKGADFTMDYLAKSIRISKRTIYERYKSKEEIIALIFKIKIKDIHEQHQQVLANDTLSIEEKLTNYFTVHSRVFNMLETDKVRTILEKVPTLIDDIADDINADWRLLHNFVEEEIEKGNIKPINVDTFILILKSLNYQMLEHTNFTFEEMKGRSKEAVKQLLNGIINK